MTGSRVRRRGSAAAIFLTAVAAMVAFMLLTHLTQRHTAHVHEGPRPALLKQLDKVMPGVTEAVVRKRLGAPSKVAGKCWQYDVNQPLHVLGQTHTLEAERICFFDHMYAVQYTRWQGDDGWNGGDGQTVANPTQ